jgi:Domain of unknown function (DUF4184)
MAPDFPYFVLMPHNTGLGHTLKGLFAFCLPSGIAVLWLFHAIMKRPLLSVAPDSLRERICDRPFPFLPLSRFARIAVSIVLGAATHIVWDAFTHRQGFIVDDMPALRMSTPFANQPIYNLLQLGSSVVGLAILGWVYMRWLRRTNPCTGSIVQPLPSGLRNFVVSTGVIVSLGFGLGFGFYSARLYSHLWLAAFVVRAIIGTMAAGYATVLLFSLWWHARSRKTAITQST